MSANAFEHHKDFLVPPYHSHSIPAVLSPPTDLVVDLAWQEGNTLLPGLGDQFGNAEFHCLFEGPIPLQKLF